MKLYEEKNSEKCVLVEYIEGETWAEYQKQHSEEECENVKKKINSILCT